MIYTSESLAAYLDAIGNHPILTRKEEAKILTLAQAGSKRAESILIRCNLRFVVKVATKFQNRGLEMDELITEGEIGLQKAIACHDIARGLRLGSYAVWWIRAFILKALEQQARLIRLPGNMEKPLRVFRGLELEQCIGGDLRARTVPREGEGPVSLPKPIQEAADAMAPFSIDAPMTDEGEGYAAFLASAGPSPEDWTAARSDGEYLARLIHKLNPQERRIVTQCFGLENGEPLDLEVIGRQYGLSRERVRQIKEKAVEKLKKEARK